jgi:hypothetical protein
MDSILIYDICDNVVRRAQWIVLLVGIANGAVIHSLTRTEKRSTACRIESAILNWLMSAAASCALAIIVYRPTYIFNGIAIHIVVPLFCCMLVPSAIYAFVGIFIGFIYYSFIDIISFVYCCFIDDVAAAVSKRIAETAASATQVNQ